MIRTPAEAAFHAALTKRAYGADAYVELNYLLDVIDTDGVRNLLIETAGVDAYELTTALSACQQLCTGLRAALALLPGE